MKTFRRELEELINKHSMENGSNTPDFILAEYLMDCLRNFDKTIKHRDQWYGKRLVRDLVDDGNDDQQKLMDQIDYHNFCARSTLYPGKSMSEVADIQYMQRVDDAYKFLNSVLIGTKPMNSKETRQWVTKTLTGRLRHDVVVVCNEVNNTPEVIDNCLLIARIMRSNSSGEHGYKYLDMIFGAEQQVRQYQAEQHLDNMMFKFIQTGI